MAHSSFALGATSEPVPIGDDEIQHTRDTAYDHDFQGIDWLSAELRVQDVGERMSQVQATERLAQDLHVLQDGRDDQDSGPGEGRPSPLVLSFPRLSDCPGRACT